VRCGIANAQPANRRDRDEHAVFEAEQTRKRPVAFVAPHIQDADFAVPPVHPVRRFERRPAQAGNAILCVAELDERAGARQAVVCNDEAHGTAASVGHRADLGRPNQ